MARCSVCSFYHYAQLSPETKDLSWNRPLPWNDLLLCSKIKVMQYGRCHSYKFAGLKRSRVGTASHFFSRRQIRHLSNCVSTQCLSLTRAGALSQMVTEEWPGPKLRIQPDRSLKIYWWVWYNEKHTSSNLPESSVSFIDKGNTLWPAKSGDLHRLGMITPQT